MVVERHAAHRSHFFCLPVSVCAFKPVAGLLRVKPCSRCSFEALLLGEDAGAVAAEEDVFAVVLDCAGCGDGMADTLNSGDGAAVLVNARHETGVELVTTLRGVDSAAASVEQAVVFEYAYHLLDGVFGRAAIRENGLPN